MDDAEKSAKRAKAFRDADWGVLAKLTEKYAVSHLRGRFKESAKDVSQTAITKVLAGDFTWDQDRVPDLEEHLRHAVNTVAWNRMTGAAESRRAHDGEGAIAVAIDAGPSPETVANNRELLEMCAEELVERFGQKGLDYLRVVDELPEHQAEQMGITPEQMYRVRHKTAEYCKEVLRQPYLDSKGLVVEGAPLRERAEELSAEIAALLEQNVYAGSRRRIRIYAMRALLVASLATLVAIALWWFMKTG